MEIGELLGAHTPTNVVCTAVNSKRNQVSKDGKSKDCQQRLFCDLHT